MKRLLLLVAVFAGTLSLSAQRNMQVWEGNTYSEFFTEVVDSVTFLLSPEGVLRECKTDTVFITKTDTVVKHDTITMVKYDTIYIEPKGDEVIGRFAVSADKQVSFAPGNLQYTRSTNTWSFAEHQYDTIGGANVSGSALTDKIDLFGWGTGNNPTQSTSDYSDYQTFVDWGNNTIGDDAPNTWRTLTYDEWEYLFLHTRWTMARVNGTLGFILLPTDFTVPSGMTVAVLGDGNMSDNYIFFSASDYVSNVYTADQFADLESLGCVFLPCAGYRTGSDVGHVGSDGGYWSATPRNESLAKCLAFGSYDAGSDSWYNRNYGLSVRLVQDIK